MKKLILHIGMHKTGSTSIQESLGRSREFLQKNNIWYPSMSEVNHTVNFTPIFSNDPLKDITFKIKQITTMDQARKEQEAMKQVWIEELRKVSCETVIISAEGCSMLLEPRVREMKAFLDQFFDDYLILIYVREPRSFYVSVIQQMFKHTDVSFDNFSFRKPDQLFTRRLPPYLNVFGRERVVVRPFNRKAFKNGDLIDDFFDSVGIDIDTSHIQRIYANESLGYNTTVLLSELNKRYPGFINGKYNPERGLSKNVGKIIEIFSRVDNKKLQLELHFSKEDAEYVNNEIEFINQFLNESDRFEKVEPSDTPNRFPTIKDLEDNYLIDLINEYNKEIEALYNASLVGQSEIFLKKVLKWIKNIRPLRFWR